MRWFSLVMLVVLTVGCKSREEQVKEAEEDAKFATDKKAAIAKGVGEALKGKGAEGAKTLGEGVGDVLKGVAKGFDTSLGSVEIRTAGAVTDVGIKAERAGYRTPDDAKTKDISVYLVFGKDYKGELLLKALEKDKKEVGRAMAQVDQKAGSATYVDFAFDERTPIKLIDHVELGVK